MRFAKTYLAVAAVLISLSSTALAGSGSPEWLPASSNLWTGVKLYQGATKQDVFEVLGGNEHYVTPGGKKIRGIRVRYPNGTVEWKDRSWVISKGNFVVRADDPALKRQEWQEFER